MSATGLPGGQKDRHARASPLCRPFGPFASIDRLFPDLTVGAITFRPSGPETAMVGVADALRTGGSKLRSAGIVY
jgi:hypothetical protein